MKITLIALTPVKYSRVIEILEDLRISDYEFGTVRVSLCLTAFEDPGDKAEIDEDGTPQFEICLSVTYSDRFDSDLKRTISQFNLLTSTIAFDKLVTGRACDACLEFETPADVIEVTLSEDLEFVDRPQLAGEQDPAELNDPL